MTKRAEFALRYQWAHFPADAKMLLRSARVRPREHGCFENAQRVVMRSSLPGLRYAKGWVRLSGSDEVFVHAWVVMNGKPVDVTLPELPQIFTRRTFTPRQLGRVLVQRGEFHFITPELIPSRGIHPPGGWWPRTCLECRGEAISDTPPIESIIAPSGCTADGRPDTASTKGEICAGE